MSPARRAAFEILEQIAGSSAHSDDLLHGAALQELSQADKNLATTLVLGVLRWQIALVDRLLALLERPEQPLPGPVQTALLLGAFQLLHTDRIPAHAALSESVELVHRAGHPGAAGLVNAVLRKLAAAIAEKKPAAPPIYESIAAAATRLGHPGWLVERWAKRYGRAAALAICEHDQAEPTPGRMFEPEEDPEGNPDGDRAVVQGEMPGQQNERPQIPPAFSGWRMDDGSRLVAELAAVSHPGPARFWDCCAAPGGKTLVVAQRQPNMQVVATDVSPRRLQTMALRLREALPERDVRTAVADATGPGALEGETAGLFDLILCDVPCSGTGTLARNPEIRERLRLSDLAGQAERQRRILRSALGRLAPGGRLLYSTCSLEPEENEHVVEAVLADPSAAGLRLLPLRESAERLRTLGRVRAGMGLQHLLAGPFLRTLPSREFRGDGFFGALIGRD